MKKINNIALFCKDKCIIAMLKGYCYANNIDITVVDFNVHGINEVAKQKPDLILVQLNLVNGHRRTDTNLLRLVATRGHVKICCLNTMLNPVISSELPVWIDEIINNPFDIAEIAGYIKKSFLSNTCFNENKCYRERHSFTDGSSNEFNNNGDDGYKVIRNLDSQLEDGDSGFTIFKIDQSNKCLFLDKRKVYLTPKEFELIELLLSDINRVFMNDEIINRLWPESHRATKSDLYQFMHLLRKKIEKDLNNPQFIMTIRGFGYRLNVVYSDRINENNAGTHFAYPSQS
jgi:DNA-binding response OmpR family regulator